jgi:hypothetical protein
MVFKWGHKKITENFGDGPRFVVLKPTLILQIKFTDLKCDIITLIAVDSFIKANGPE